MTTNIENRHNLLRKVGFILAATAGPVETFFKGPRRLKTFLAVSAPIMLIGFILHYLLMGMLISVVAYLFITKRDPQSNQTWVEYFCSLLQSYQPCDEAAYQELLQKVSNSTADRQAIVNWYAAEKRAVERPGEVVAEKSLIDSRLGK